jgi:hypothetical protein
LQRGEEVLVEDRKTHGQSGNGAEAIGFAFAKFDYEAPDPTTAQRNPHH